MSTNDEFSSSAPEPSDAEVPPDSADPAEQSAADRIRATLGLGEQMVALGALIIVVFVDLVGNVLLDDYNIGTPLLWGTALAAIAVMWLHRFAGSTWFGSYDKVIIFLGFAGGVLGIRELLFGIDGGLPDDLGVLFGIGAYVGAGLMAYGAFLIARSD
jgi:hypothetical protein